MECRPEGQLSFWKLGREKCFLCFCGKHLGKITDWKCWENDDNSRWLVRGQEHFWKVQWEREPGIFSPRRGRKGELGSWQEELKEFVWGTNNYARLGKPQLYLGLETHRWVVVLRKTALTQVKNEDDLIFWRALLSKNCFLPYWNQSAGMLTKTQHLFQI